MGKLKRALPVVWDISEKERLKELIKSIKKRSVDLADRIREELRSDLQRIQQNPYIFEADPLKENNDGDFRKFNVLQLRITYKIDPDKIIILRVRHAASEPIDF